jgi:hypothetical protein
MSIEFSINLVVLPCIKTFLLLFTEHGISTNHLSLKVSETQCPRSVHSGGTCMDIEETNDTAVVIVGNIMKRKMRFGFEASVF